MDDAHQEGIRANEKSDLRSVVVRGSAAGFAQKLSRACLGWLLTKQWPQAAWTRGLAL
jgi:hypothetical protein